MTAIILVNYNSTNYTIDCIESIKQTIDYNELKIVIIDNKSNNNELEKLDSYCSTQNAKDIFLIKNNENGGFASANNIGITFAIDNLKCDKVMLLNNDTIVKPDFHMLLCNKLNDYQVVTPMVLFESEKDKIWSAGGYISSFKGIGVNRGFMDTADKYKENIECEFTPFCCVLFDARVFKKVGLLDDSYFMYFEDADYCMLLAKFGYKILYVADSIIYHKVSASSGGLRSNFYLEWMTRNQLKFIKKFFNKWSTMVLFRVKIVIKKIYYFFHFNFEAIKSINRGIRE